jgi:hypothetical protein
VRVDKARHQNPVAAIDDPDVRVERGLGRLDRLDRPAVDDDPPARQERVRLARTLVKATRELGPAEARLGVLPDPVANTPNEAPMDEARENFRARCAFRRANAGV